MLNSTACSIQLLNFLNYGSKCMFKFIIVMYWDIKNHISCIRIVKKPSEDVFNHRNKHIDSDVDMSHFTVEFSSFEYLTVEIWIFNEISFSRRLSPDVSNKPSHATYSQVHCVILFNCVMWAPGPWLSVTHCMYEYSIIYVSNSF